MSPDEDWAALNAKFRRVAMGYRVRLGEWSSSGRSSSRSAGSFLGQFGLGSGLWERKQRSIAARSSLRGTKQRRKYRMEVAALGEFEEKFLTSIGR